MVAITPGFPDDGSILCRAVGPVTLPNGQSFTQYVTDAFRLELTAAGVHDPLGNAELRMKLLRIDFQTTPGATNWYIDGEYAIGSNLFLISSVYNDRSSYFGQKACANMALYFRHAVGLHIRDVFRHPSFRTQLALSPEPEPTQSTTGDAAARLRQLDSLYKDGLIGKEDYDIRRQRILDGI
jgi:hypothetical protein